MSHFPEGKGVAVGPGCRGLPPSLLAPFGSHCLPHDVAPLESLLLEAGLRVPKCLATDRWKQELSAYAKPWDSVRDFSGAWAAFLCVMHVLYTQWH